MRARTRRPLYGKRRIFPSADEQLGGGSIYQTIKPTLGDFFGNSPNVNDRLGAVPKS